MTQPRGSFALLSQPVSRRRLLRYTGASALGLAALPLLAACGGGSSTATSGAAAGSGASTTAPTVKMSDNSKYAPDKLTVAKGAKVTWDNSGAMVHTVTCDPSKAIKNGDVVLPSGAQPFDSGNIEAGKTWSYTFTVAGDYTYFCIPHESDGMIGHVTVTG
jgi:plastocyanin